MKERFLADRLQKRREEGAFRTLTHREGLVDFASNDYLGMARNKALAEVIHQATQQVPLGATGSRLLTGNSTELEALEDTLSEFFQVPAALLFNSGYDANLAVLSSIPQKGDTILYDALAHACIKDGARLSAAQRFSFRHNDLEDLVRKGAKATGQCFVVVESIYSMDGDAAPLQALVELCTENGWWLVVDEAHSTGVYGAYGEGSCVEAGVADHVFARVHTFGKALGQHGAAVVGSQLLRDYLVNFARPFIYTTALPPHSVVAIGQALAFLKAGSPDRTSLFDNIRLFRALTQALPFQVLDSQSPIQGVVVPGNASCRAVSDGLVHAGYDVRPILSPTVKAGSERLRICLHAFNSPAEITGLVEELKRNRVINEWVDEAGNRG
jgi:8-amino-7-oxononanoate synthase